MSSAFFPLCLQVRKEERWPDVTANTPVSQNAVSYVGTNHVCLTDLHSAGCSVMLHVLDNYFQSQMKTVLSYLSSVFRGPYEEFNHFHLKAFYNSTLPRAETCPFRCKPSRQVTEDRLEVWAAWTAPVSALATTEGPCACAQSARSHTLRSRARGGHSADWNSPWHLKRECF